MFSAVPILYEHHVISPPLSCSCRVPTGSPVSSPGRCSVAAAEAVPVRGSPAPAWPSPALPSRHRRSQDARKLRGGRHSAQHLAGDQRSSSSSSAAAQHAVLCQWWRPAAGAVVWPVARLVQVTPELSPVMY